MIRPTKNTIRNFDQLRKTDSIFKRSIETALFTVGSKVVKEVRRLITEPPKTGRLYRYKGRIHQASAPGESPANMSGKLRASSEYNVRNEEKMEVGEKAPYAKFLEEGTSKMEPRPHLKRAIDNEQRNTQNTLGFAPVLELRK